MRPKLALIFLFALATIYPSSSCNCKTYAQESGDIVAVDSNAGIMTLAAGDIAYISLDDLIKAKSGNDCYFYGGYSDNDRSWLCQTYRYDYILKDIPDDDGYDSWFYYGCLIAYAQSKNGVVWSWRRFVFSGELYKLSTGAWAVKRFSISFGLPSYVGTNVYNVTYEEGANFFSQYVACLRKAFDLQKAVDNDDSIFNAGGLYDNYINFETHDTDNGGVNNLAEWVRGTLIDDWTDDNPSGNSCMCGACCGCECKCGKWDGPKCAGLTGEGGCDCHFFEDENPEGECACSKYCCKHTCECKKCASSGEHSQHKNGSSTCAGSTGEGGCDCHKDENPDEECACSKYCCLDKCECKAHPSGEGHVAHQNGSAYCNQEADPKSGGCSCHGTTEEECTCSKYCCLHKCECKAPHLTGEHGKHQNGSTYCNRDPDPKLGGCPCHGVDDEECACSKYCCLDKCECKAHPSGGHGKHQNGLTYCNKGTDPESGGCSCHATEEFDPPEQPDFEELEADERKLFLSSSYESDPKSFAGSLLRLRTELNKKFKFDTVTSRWSGVKFSGELPCFEIELPADFGMIAVDFSTFKEYSEILRLRSILAFGVFFYFISAVIRDIKKFL